MSEEGMAAFQHLGEQMLELQLERLRDEWETAASSLRHPAWTPGPWRTASEGWDIYAESEGRYIAEMRHSNEEHDHKREPNARLIAVAPEMATFIEWVATEKNSYGDDISEWLSVYGRSIAAYILSRARGEA